MNEETFNLSMRKFLKMVGVRSQAEIEKALAHALAHGQVAGTESFPATMTLVIAGLGVHVTFEGQVTLE